MKGLIFTYLLTYGGSLVSLFRPYYGLLVYVAFAIIKPEALWHWSVPAGNYSRIVAIALLVGWALAGGGKWDFGKGKPVAIALFLFWVLLALGCLQAPNKDLAAGHLEGLSKAFLPFFIGMSMIDSVKQLRQLAWVILLSQGYLAFEFNLTYRAGAFDPDEFMFGGLDNNSVAITMVTGFGLAFFLGVHAERWWAKLVAFALAACMVHVVLFSMSRGGVTALIFTALVIFLLIPKRPATMAVLAVTVVLTLWFMGPQVRARFATTFAAEEKRDASASLRMRHWTACWQSMQSEPLGIGTANWPTVSPRYGLPSMAGHSTWFQTGAETGFPGLLCLFGFYFINALRLWPIARGRVPVSDPWLTYLARMVVASIVGFVVSAQFVSLEGVELPYYIAMVGVGALRLSSRESGEAEDASAAETLATRDDEFFATPAAASLANRSSWNN